MFNEARVHHAAATSTSPQGLGSDQQTIVGMAFDGLRWLAVPRAPEKRRATSGAG